MATSPLKIDGLKELENALSQLPDNVAKRALKRAVRAGANEIRKQVRALAPYRHVKRAIIIRQADRSGTSIYTVSDDVGVNLRVAPDYHWYEFGIPHSWTITAGSRVGKRLAPTGKKVLYSEDTKIVYGRQVVHPPLAARPFIRPGMVSGAQKATEALKRILSQAIFIESSKLARRTR